eukprot:6592559-Alexandrium_andersonii.AAC.1
MCGDEATPKNNASSHAAHALRMRLNFPSPLQRGRARLILRSPKAHLPTASTRLLKIAFGRGQAAD